MKRSSLILLILCNLVWTLNPLMGKRLLQNFGGIQVAWLRYASGFACFFLFALFSVIARRKTWRDYFLVPTNLRTWLELFALAIGPFVYSPILQFIGLESTQAMDNSILIATEPLISILLAWGVLGERMTRDQWISMGLALAGFFLFSGAGVTLSIGMILLLFAQLGEAAYSVFGRKLVQLHAPTAVLGTAMGIGSFVLTLVVLFFDRFPPVVAIGPGQAGALLWLGPLGSTVTYLIWAMIARSVTVPSMVITLFIQPVLGAFLGYLILGETLTAERAAGAGLILAAVALLSYREIRRSPVI